MDLYATECAFMRRYALSGLADPQSRGLYDRNHGHFWADTCPIHGLIPHANVSNSNEKFIGECIDLLKLRLDNFLKLRLDNFGRGLAVWAMVACFARSKPVFACSQLRSSNSHVSGGPE